MYISFSHSEGWTVGYLFTGFWLQWNWNTLLFRIFTTYQKGKILCSLARIERIKQHWVAAGQFPDSSNVEMFLKREWKFSILSWELAHASRASTGVVFARHKWNWRHAESYYSQKSSRELGYSRTSWIVKSRHWTESSKSMPGQLLSHPTWLVNLPFLENLFVWYFITRCFLFRPPISILVPRVGYLSSFP